MDGLPIDALIPGIVSHLRTERNLVLEAPPGAGKTTRVPRALMELDSRQVLVLEPRRLAARLAARYVAGELGEVPGGTVGYQVRFENVTRTDTRLRFLTEGVLTRRMLTDRRLLDVHCVVLDEFHERHLEGDLALALLRNLQRTRRPELRIVVMSATLDAAPIAEYLGGARVMRSEGRQHPLEIEYTPHSAAPLEQQVAAGVERALAHERRGHMLVFLPGAAEIRRAQTACAALAQRAGLLLLPLHGDQSPAEQDAAVGPSDRRKIILSTNVAESSITIDGVSVVIDSGQARVAGHSPWSGLPTLAVSRISQASANQRAGRAGRTGPGLVIRLYPLDDFVRRPAQDLPEAARADLTPAALLVRAMGLDGLAAVEWLDAPPAAHIEHAEDLLRQLGATGQTGRDMARYPLHPRLSRLIVEALRRGVAEDGCTVAGLLSAGERLPQQPRHATRSDLLVLAEGRMEPRVQQVVRQIHRLVNPPKQEVKDEEALLISVLTAFPDRVARRRSGSELQMASGGSAQLASSSTVTEAQLLVAVEAEERSDQQAPVVRVASAVDPIWLLDLFPGRVTDVSRIEWNRKAERVEGRAMLMFDQIPIEVSAAEPDPVAAATLLAEKALEAGVYRFGDQETLDAFLDRARFAEAYGGEPAAHLPVEALRRLAEGLKSFAELEAVTRQGGLLREMERQMTAAGRRLIEEVAPRQVRLPGPRMAPVHYPANQPPWIASRLQDFFGLRETPTVARGAVRLVVHLLAPNQRPVQMTTDLAGFWERLYPQVRRELSRRYPKHKWPENPVG
ncbi:MAG TPA: ATP-dependent helicase HrpB [Candidatus Sulfopaludibacter sp.]|jgi:ATP-dependent helicase HrpB|nr:ATP-dependent helicase HrpB [Candidatus Sulfopaludibacter sp.]